MSRKFWVLTVTICLLLSLPGCWDVLDIRNRAFITAIGLDQPEDPEKRFKVSVEVIKPMNLRPEAHEEASIIATVESYSIGQALEQLQTKVSRPLSLSHLRLILVGEEIARTVNFEDIMAFFKRHREVQARLGMMVVQDAQALDLFHTQPDFEKYVSADLIRMLRLAHASLNRSNSFFDFTKNLLERDGVALANKVEIDEQEKAVIQVGGGIYNKWKLVEWLNDGEVKNANWIVGDGNATIDAQIDQGIYTYLAEKKTLRIDTSTDSGEIRFQIRLKTDGTIFQQQGKHLDMAKIENIKFLENLFSQTIQRQVEEAINHSQNLGVDYLGFGEKLKKHQFQTYQSVDWEEIFPEIPFDVQVESVISRFGVAP